MKTIFITLINTVILLTCICCSSYPKYFTNYYTGTYTGLDTLINLQGYYISLDCDDHYEKHCTMTMFYTNGLVTHCIISTRNPEEYLINTYKGEKKKFAWLDWGSYIIKNDTIKVQTYIPGSFYAGIDNCIEHADFKLLPGGKIQLVSLYLHSKSWNYDWKLYPDCNQPSTFFPLETKADSTKCPLLKKKWFWGK